MQAEQANIVFLPEKEWKKRIFGARLESLQRAGGEIVSRRGLKRKANASTSSRADFIPAPDPVLAIRGDASPSEQHHLPSKSGPHSQDQPWGGFYKAGSPKEPSKIRLSFAASHTGGWRLLCCCFRAKCMKGWSSIMLFWLFLEFGERWRVTNQDYQKSEFT